MVKAIELKVRSNKEIICKGAALRFTADIRKPKSIVKNKQMYKQVNKNQTNK